MTQEKVYGNLKVNQGFPAGNSYKDLKVGRWVKVRWDNSEDQWGFITSFHQHPYNFKGERRVEVFTFDEQGMPKGIAPVVHTQLIEFGDGSVEPRPTKPEVTWTILVDLVDPGAKLGRDYRREHLLYAHSFGMTYKVGKVSEETAKTLNANCGVPIGS